MHRREALQRIALLTGGALSFSTVSAVLSGCQARPDGDYEPAALSSELNELVATIADLIIPETDTPGAREAGVHTFIDQTLAQWMTIREREHFFEGLESFYERVAEQYGEPFVELDESDQVAILQEEDAVALEEDDEMIEVRGDTAWIDEREEEIVRVPGTGEPEFVEVTLRPWFRTMKELTLVGYYTSEIGATQELQYEHVPGRYIPCAPVEEIGRAWA